MENVHARECTRMMRWSWAEQRHIVPSPLVGEGQGEGWRQMQSAKPVLCMDLMMAVAFISWAQTRNKCSACDTPLPVPPPQGGREPCGAHHRNSHNAQGDGLEVMIRRM